MRKTFAQAWLRLQPGYILAGWWHDRRAIFEHLVEETREGRLRWTAASIDKDWDGTHRRYMIRVDECAFTMRLRITYRGDDCHTDIKISFGKWNKILNARPGVINPGKPPKLTLTHAEFLERL